MRRSGRCAGAVTSDMAACTAARFLIITGCLRVLSASNDTPATPVRVAS